MVREWVPDCDINGVVQIAHGHQRIHRAPMSFARHLPPRALSSWGNDHLGHGESVLGPVYLGFFRAGRGLVQGRCGHGAAARADGGQVARGALFPLRPLDGQLPDTHIPDSLSGRAAGGRYPLRHWSGAGAGSCRWALPLRWGHAQERPHAPQRGHLQRRLRQLQQGL